MKKILVCGAGGFIGTNLVNKLKKQGHYVTGIDLHIPLYSNKSNADSFYLIDLTNQRLCDEFFNNNYFDEVYQLAADMGGAGYLFTGENDANVMYNSAMINLNILSAHRYYKKIFYSSSACIYPKEIQTDIIDPKLPEYLAYPANPDSEYGWEKLFSERIYTAYHKNLGVDIRIARFHNIYGPEGTWEGGKDKSPAAFCRKILMSNGKEMEMWGDGNQTRSYLYIDDCLDAIEKLMESNYTEPLNIGSEEMVSMNDFAKMIMEIENKQIKIKHIPGPVGVRGRKSENTLIKQILNWEPKYTLKNGIINTYYWIKDQIEMKYGKNIIK